MSASRKRLLFFGREMPIVEEATLFCVLYQVGVRVVYKKFCSIFCCIFQFSNTSTSGSKLITIPRLWKKQTKQKNHQDIPNKILSTLQFKQNKTWSSDSLSIFFISMHNILFVNWKSTTKKLGKHTLSCPQCWFSLLFKKIIKILCCLYRF